MKRKGKIILTLSTCLTFGVASLSALTACGQQTSNEDIKIIVTGGKNGIVGETIQLQATIIGGGSVTWTSNDVSVATVDENGLVTLVGPGQVEIVAKSTVNPSKQSSPVSITVFNKEGAQKRLEILSLPTTTKYKTGSKFSLDGIVVMGYMYFDGTKDVTSGEEIQKSQIKSSIQDGATLSTKGTQTVTISADGYQVGAAFTITVDDSIKESKLYISKFPKKTSYEIVDGVYPQFDDTGLEVKQLDYVDGVLKKETKVSPILSIIRGTTLDYEGTHEISVSVEDKSVESASFSVMVYTKDTSIYDLIKNLQTAKNFQVEITNSVGTTKDAAGFHYLRTYTENYYSDIEYQNVTNSDGNVEFSTQNTKSHIGYCTYTDGDEKGIMQFEENGIGTIVGSTVVTTGVDSWWDKASTLATLFNVFTLDLLPTKTLNGRFLTTSIEQVPGDNDDGDLTIQKYPLVKEFLSFCGWSDALITIMSRFTIEISDGYKLSMKADFGNYGITEAKVTAFGNAKNSKVEKAISKGLKPNKTIDTHVQDLADLFLEDNYTRFSYGDNGITSTVLNYFNKNYYYTPNKGQGYCVLDDGIYTFTGKKSVFAIGAKVSDTKDLPAYLGTNQERAFGGPYLSEGIKGVLGEGGNSNKLHTFAKFAGFSAGNEICYQSFDSDAIAEFENAYAGQPVEDGRFWWLAHYSDSSLAKETIQTVEIWDIAFTGSGGSGFILACGNLGSTSVDWIETGINSANAGLAK